jgi:hypothetical protein
VAAKNYNNAQVGGIEGRGREQGEQDGGWKGERERETIEGREGGREGGRGKGKKRERWTCLRAPTSLAPDKNSQKSVPEYISDIKL